MPWWSGQRNFRFAPGAHVLADISWQTLAAVLLKAVPNDNRTVKLETLNAIVLKIAQVVVIEAYGP